MAPRTRLLYVGDAVDRMNALVPVGLKSLDPMFNDAIDHAIVNLIDSFSTVAENDCEQARASLS